jgi:hypothetical protein
MTNEGRPAQAATERRSEGNRLAQTGRIRQDYESTSGSFFSVITGHWEAISAFSSVKGFHSSGTLSS